jgi:integrase
MGAGGQGNTTRGTRSGRPTRWLHSSISAVCVLAIVLSRLGKVIPYLFPHQDGTRRRDFRKAWATACKAAGVAGRTRHDLRRTAVRTMEQRGVPRSVAMKLTGHKTESVYRRYAIVDKTQLQEAAAKLAGAKLAHGPVSVPFRGGRAKTRSLTR